MPPIAIWPEFLNALFNTQYHSNHKETGKVHKQATKRELRSEPCSDDRIEREEDTAADQEHLGQLFLPNFQLARSKLTMISCFVLCAEAEDNHVDGHDQTNDDQNDMNRQDGNKDLVIQEV